MIRKKGCNCWFE